MKVTKVESCKNWKLPILKVAKIESYQFWKLPKLKVTNFESDFSIYCYVAKLPNCQVASCLFAFLPSCQSASCKLLNCELAIMERNLSLSLLLNDGAKRNRLLYLKIIYTAIRKISYLHKILWQPHFWEEVFFVMLHRQKFAQNFVTTPFLGGSFFLLCYTG